MVSGYKAFSWGDLSGATQMLKKISKGSKCTACANYLFLKKLNSINVAYYMQTKNGNLAPLLILPVAYLWTTLNTLFLNIFKPSQGKAELWSYTILKLNLMSTLWKHLTIDIHL